MYSFSPLLDSVRMWTVLQYVKNNTSNSTLQNPPPKPDYGLIQYNVDQITQAKCVHIGFFQASYRAMP